MDQTAEVLKDRTKRFAIRILDLAATTPRTEPLLILMRQLVRAGFGVVGNYRAACRSRSHAEFTARIAVVVEEADESELWLDIMNEKRWGAERLRSEVLRESRELRAIFARTYSTARSREPRRK